MKTSKNDSSLKVPTPQLNRHDLSHQSLTTIDFYRLQPIECFECVEGDKIKINVRSLIDSAPLATKVYGSCHLDLHAFFVPFRIIWSEWNRYYYDDGNSIKPTLPSISFGDEPMRTRFGVYDGNPVNNYKKAGRAVLGGLGYPVYSSWFNKTTIEPDQWYSSLPYRAYSQIWWDWFRDSVNVLEKDKSRYVLTTSGNYTSDNVKAIVPHFRTFQKDPISMLLNSPNAVVGSSSSTARGSFIETFGGTSFDTFRNAVTASSGSPSVSHPVVPAGLKVGSNSAGSSLNDLHSLYPNLSVPVLRGAVALQRFLERLGISGTRPLERIMSTFGVRPTPERLDMSEFIGYKSIPIGIDGLVNTGSSSRLGNNDNPFGNDETSSFGVYGGRSSASGQSDTWSYNATEHGYIMVIASVIPDFIHMGVVPPHCTRGAGPNSDGFKDFFHPDFDGVGYTDVLLRDISQPLSAVNHSDSWANADSSKVVGYQPMYENYRFSFDIVSGDFLEPASYKYLRNMMWARNIPEFVSDPDTLQAGLMLSTANEVTSSLFDNNFQVTSSNKDHFILNNFIVIDALRPISSSQLPTELSDLANSDLREVSKGGVRL